MNTGAFHSIPDSTVDIVVSNVSQTFKLADTEQTKQVRLANDGTASVSFKFGNSAATTITFGAPNKRILAGVTEVFSVQGGPIYITVIAAGSTGTLSATPGEGV